MFASRPSRLALCIALLVLTVSCAQAALTSGEISALNEILNAFPSLANPDQDPALYSLFGGATTGWATDKWATVCTGATANGYDVHGVLCANGHVAGLVFSDAWGNIGSGKSLPSLGNLTYLNSLQSVGNMPLTSSFNTFATALFQKVSLQSVTFRNRKLDSPALYDLVGNHSSLTSITFDYAVSQLPNFSELTSLENLFIRMGSQFTDLTPLLPCAASLRSLSLLEPSALANLTYLDEFSVLENLTINLASDTPEFPPTITLPVNLVSFEMVYAPNTPTAVVATGTKFKTFSWIAYNGFSLTEIPDTVSVLYISSYSGGLATGLDIIFPSALTTLGLELGTFGVPVVNASLAACSHLSYLNVFQTDLNSFLSLSPSLRSTSLDTLILTSSSRVTESTLSNFVCNLVDNTKLVHLELGGGIAFYPLCGSAHPYPKLQTISATYVPAFNSTQFAAALDYLPGNLTSLTIMGSSGGASDGSFDWAGLVTKFPNLQKLNLVLLAIGGTFPEQLTALSSLNTLSLLYDNLEGPIPEDLFQKMPHLKRLDVSNNRLNGTFPWYGLQTLEVLTTPYNSFESWPSIAGGAPNLNTVDFSYNPALVQIPDDASFMSMPSLQQLSFSHNTALGGPLPAFWGNHPSIQEVDLSYCALGGHLPDVLVSRYLQSLHLEYNQICGPAFNVPFQRGLTEMHLEHNRISGSYPSDWSRLTVTEEFDVSSNYMNGTFSGPILSTICPKLRSIDLSNNSFSGGVPNFSSFPGLTSISLQDTSLDLCASSPAFTTFGMSCNLDNVAVDMCNCSHSWAPCFKFCGSTPPPAAIINPTPGQLQCIVPPPRPGAAPVPGTTVPTATSAAPPSNLPSIVSQLSKIALGAAIAAFLL